MYYYIFSIFLAPLFALFAVAAFDQQRYAVISPTHFFISLPFYVALHMLSNSFNNALAMTILPKRPG